MKQSRLALRAKYKTWANKECKKRNSKVGLKRSSLVSANSALDPFNGFGFAFNGFALSFSGLALSSRLGVWCAKRRRLVEGEAREDFGVIQAATLTLLALVIGFTFSMALNRYDQRKLRGRRGQRHRHGIRTGRSAAGGRRSEGAGAAAGLSRSAYRFLRYSVWAGAFADQRLNRKIAGGALVCGAGSR
jgi:hypothetical protein